MRYQALLLALIILISLLISPAGIKNTFLESPKSVVLSVPNEPKPSKLPNPFSVFMGNMTSAIINETAIIGQNLNSAINAFGENLAPAKTLLTDNQDKLDPVLSQDTLTSQSNIISENTFPCSFEQPNFKSQAILIKNLKQFPSVDETIFQLNSAKRWPIASLSKLMTAVIAFEQINKNKKIILSEKAVASDGTAGDFKAGETFRVDDLIKAMLVVSSNDAAYAVAENFDGGWQNFINEMQKKAAELKMFSTSYLEPTGLSFINQSSADDLSRLVDYIYLNHPEIFEISKQKEISIIELKSNKPRKLLNIDKFAGETDFIGGKTGYIDESGHNLVALFNINARHILIITFGSDDAFAETEKIKELVQGCK